MTISYMGSKGEQCTGPQIVIKHGPGTRESVLEPGPSQRLWNHSPDGFQWGYGGSGPAQLALAILLDITGDRERSVRLHQEFKWDKIATLGDNFVLTKEEIQDWLDQHPA